MPDNVNVTLDDVMTHAFAGDVVQLEPAFDAVIKGKIADALVARREVAVDALMGVEAEEVPAEEAPAEE